MRQGQDFDKTIRIPVITDLVRAGDADVVEQVKNPQCSPTTPPDTLSNA